MSFPSETTIPAGQLFTDRMGIVFLEIVDTLANIYSRQISQVLAAPLHHWRRYQSARRGVKQ